MLPIPSKDFFPKIFKDSPDLAALQAKLDKWNTIWKNDVLNFLNFFNPVKAPSVILDELGYLLSAGIKAGDTDDEKRKKIASAIATHKKLGEWQDDIKERIDDITGLGTLLYTFDLVDQWIIVGDGLENPLNYWSAIGADGIDLELGVTVDGGDLFTPGHIYIDFTAAITAPQLAEVIAIFEEDFIPAYLVIHLGYVSGVNFVEMAVI